MIEHEIGPMELARPAVPARDEQGFLARWNIALVLGEIVGFGLAMTRGLTTAPLIDQLPAAVAFGGIDAVPNDAPLVAFIGAGMARGVVMALLPAIATGITRRRLACACYDAARDSSASRHHVMEWEG